MLIGKDTSSLHTEQLLEGVKNAPLGGKLFLSLILHIVVILLTSISFIGLCLKYESLQPRPLHEAAMAAEEAEAEASGESTQPSAGTEKEPVGEGDPVAVSNPESAPASEPVESALEEKSLVEQQLEETSDERPAQSAIGFDDIDSL